MTLSGRHREALFPYLLRLADDRLILGHRLSEWCGHAPILEEDIALANIALDCLGQASALLRLAGEIEGEGRSEDDLAYFREAVEFRNCLLVEQPRGDFAFTMVRQFLYDSFAELHYGRLRSCPDAELAGIAAKAHQENRYHLRHSSQWLLRLGDGTEESNQRAQGALQELWRFTGELFQTDRHEHHLIAIGFVPDRRELRPEWDSRVKGLLAQATLTVPDESHQVAGGAMGNHSEHLGHLLAEMQILARSFPEAEW